MQGTSRERRLLGAPPGHPARGRIYCRGRSPGLRVVAAVRPSRSRVASVTRVGQRLAVYSCGGSAGIAPASLLAPDQAGPGEPRQHRLSGRAGLRQARGHRHRARCEPPTGPGARSPHLIADERTSLPMPLQRGRMTTAGHALFSQGKNKLACSCTLRTRFVSWRRVRVRRSHDKGTPAFHRQSPPAR